MQIGKQITYVTDANGNITSEKHSDTTGEIYTVNYTYDANGNITSITNTIPETA